MTDRSSSEEAIIADRESSAVEQANTNTSNAVYNDTDNKPGPPHRTMSISEAASQSYGGWNAPSWLVWFEWPFRVKDPIDGTMLTEAAGWAMDSAARGPLNQMGGYVGAAILRLAVLEAGCKSPINCNNSVKGGLKPSSLLTISSTVVGVLGAILMPLFGAVVDHTIYRKHVAIITAILCVALTGIEATISVERNNWLFILIIDAIQTFALNVHTTAVFAYLPDLTTNESVMTHYNSQFFVRQYGAQILYTLLLIISGLVRGTNKTVGSTVFTAKVAAGTACGFGLFFLSYTWLFLFRKRPALSKVPDKQTLLNTGFIQVRNTSRKIFREYNALRWFMISLLFSPEAGAGIVLAIAVSFFTIEMGFSGQQIAYITLILMVATIFGAMFSKYLCRKINPLNTYRSGFVFLSVCWGITVAVLDGPAKANAAYGLCSTWGFAMGWIYPSQRVLFCTLIPKGQETEMMGLFSFCNQILGWLPPLLVTILNQNNIKLRFGMLVVPAFCMISVTLTLPMGNYKEATEFTTLHSQTKLKEVLNATTNMGQRDDNSKKDSVGFTIEQQDNSSRENDIVL